jgi:hypothetical protein
MKNKEVGDKCMAKEIFLTEKCLFKEIKWSLNVY